MTTALYALIAIAAGATGYVLGILDASAFLARRAAIHARFRP